MKEQKRKIKILATALLGVGILTLSMGFSAINIAVAQSLVSDSYALADYCGEVAFGLYKGKNGYLYGAGDNSNGQLGRGYLDLKTKIEPLKGKILEEKVVSFDTGKSGFALALTESGKLYGWGNNDKGQLAREIKTGEDKTVNCYPTPVEISLPENCDGVAVDVGSRHSLLLTKDGGVYAWGENFYGQLGLSLKAGNKKVNVTEPTRIPQETFGNEKVVQIATSDYNGYALTESGKVYAWGESISGQIGDGALDPNDSELPDFVNAPVATLLTDVQKISAEGETAIALTKNGKVFMWGKMSGLNVLPEGQTWSSVPLQIEKTYDVTGAETNATITDILCGGATNFLLSSDGKVYSFGAGGDGALGINVEEAEKAGNPYVQAVNISVPTQVLFYEPLSIEEITKNKDETYSGKTPVDMTKIKEVNVTALLNSGGGRTFVMDVEGKVWSWGNQANGLVGSGNVVSADVPVLSTLFRDQNYDATIKEKNYMIEPIVGLSLIYGAGSLFLLYTEIKRAKQQRLEMREQENKSVSK